MPVTPRLLHDSVRHLLICYQTEHVNGYRTGTGMSINLLDTEVPVLNSQKNLREM